MEKDNNDFDPDDRKNGSDGSDQPISSDSQNTNPANNEPTYSGDKDKCQSDNEPIGNNDNSRTPDSDDSSLEENTPEWFVIRIFKGDEKAETAFCNHYKESILFILNVKYSGKPFIEDVYQEAMIAVIISLRKGSVREAKALNSYIRQTVYNIVNKYLKGDYKRKKEDDLDSKLFLEDSKRKPDEESEYDQRKNLVSNVIDEMPIERDRKILRLYYMEGRSKPEVCNTLDLSPAHFDRVLHRAKKRLKDFFDAKWGDPDNPDDKGTDSENGSNKDKGSDDDPDSKSSES